MVFIKSEGVNVQYYCLSTLGMNLLQLVNKALNILNECLVLVKWIRRLLMSLSLASAVQNVGLSCLPNKVKLTIYVVGFGRNREKSQYASQLVRMSITMVPTWLFFWRPITVWRWFWMSIWGHIVLLLCFSKSFFWTEVCLQQNHCAEESDDESFINTLQMCPTQREGCPLTHVTQKSHW